MVLRPEGGYQPEGDGNPMGPTPKGGSSVSPPKPPPDTFTRPFEAQMELKKMQLQLMKLESMAGMMVQLLQLLTDKGIRSGEIHGTERALAQQFIEKLLLHRIEMQKPVDVRWENPLGALSAYTIVRSTEEPK